MTVRCHQMTSRSCQSIIKDVHSLLMKTMNIITYAYGSLTLNLKLLQCFTLLLLDVVAALGQQVVYSFQILILDTANLPASSLLLNYQWALCRVPTTYPNSNESLQRRLVQDWVLSGRVAREGRGKAAPAPMHRRENNKTMSVLNVRLNAEHQYRREIERSNRWNTNVNIGPNLLQSSQLNAQTE
jgi:hypothetical protein